MQKKYNFFKVGMSGGGGGGGEGEGIVKNVVFIYAYLYRPSHHVPMWNMINAHIKLVC